MRLPRASGWPEGSKPNTASQGFANLEALAYAYDLTGNRKYIDAGIGALCQAVDWIINPKTESDHVFFHRILRGPFRFMTLAHTLGLLEKVPNAGPRMAAEMLNAPAIEPVATTEWVSR